MNLRQDLIVEVGFGTVGPLRSSNRKGDASGYDELQLVTESSGRASSEPPMSRQMASYAADHVAGHGSKPPSADVRLAAYAIALGPVSAATACAISRLLDGGILLTVGLTAVFSVLAGLVADPALRSLGRRGD